MQVFLPHALQVTVEPSKQGNRRLRPGKHRRQDFYGWNLSWFQDHE